MSWIPFATHLPAKAEVIAIANATSRSPREVACILMEFWGWVADHTETGVLPGMTLDRLAFLIPGTTVEFWEAVVAVRWLQVDLLGLTIPGWHRYCSPEAKETLIADVRRSRRNAKAAQRMAAYRARKKQTEVLVAPPAPQPTPQTPKKKPRTAKEKKPRPRNHLFDAITEVTGLDPTTAGAHIGKVSALLSQATPPYTPEEVRAFPAVWKARGYGSIPITPGVIEKYIGWVRQPRGVSTPGEREQIERELLARRAVREQPRPRPKARLRRETGDSLFGEEEGNGPTTEAGG